MPPIGRGKEGPEAPAGARTPPILSPLALSGVLPRGARLRVPSLGGSPASLTMVRPGCPQRGDQGFSGGGSSCSSSSSAARPRLHTHCPQGSPPPPPAPTVPQRPPRAPRLARPRPGRPTCRRTAAPADPSASPSAWPGRGSPVPTLYIAGVCCWPRAHAPAAGLLSVATRPTPCGHTTFLHGGGARSAARDESLCELRRYWARAMAEMRARRRLVGPSLQCVKLGRATAWW